MNRHIIPSRNKMMVTLNGKTISGALIFLILVSVCNSQPHYYEDDNTTKEPKVRTYHFYHTTIRSLQNGLVLFTTVCNHGAWYRNIY